MHKSSSPLELLRGLKEESLRLDDFWCDLADVAKLRSTGLVQFNLSDQTLSLTEKGRSVLSGPASRKALDRQITLLRYRGVHLRPTG